MPNEELFANFRYEVKSEDPEDWTTLRTLDYDKFDHICSQTMVGIMQNKKSKKFACAVGKKTSPDIVSHVIDNRETFSMAQTQSEKRRNMYA